MKWQNDDKAWNQETEKYIYFFWKYFPRRENKYTKLNNNNNYKKTHK